MLVDDLGVFDFITNPITPNTHLGRNTRGVYRVTSPKEGGRFKYQPAKKASKMEVKYYWEVMTPILKEREREWYEESYPRLMQEHLDNGGSIHDF